jgi:hypothetical protein
MHVPSEFTNTQGRSGGGYEFQQSFSGFDFAAERPDAPAAPSPSRLARATSSEQVGLKSRAAAASPAASAQARSALQSSATAYPLASPKRPSSPKSPKSPQRVQAHAHAQAQAEPQPDSPRTAERRLLSLGTVARGVHEKDLGSPSKPPVSYSPYAVPAGKAGEFLFNSPKKTAPKVAVDGDGDASSQEVADWLNVYTGTRMRFKVEGI